MCTTEIGRLALKYDWLQAHNTKVGRCKLHPGLKAPPVSNFDSENDSSAFNLNLCLWSLRHCSKVATLSIDPVDSHNTWLKDVVAHCENGITVGGAVQARP